jgi:phage terminase Nu1 subunit (DNA packaging protein)
MPKPKKPKASPPTQRLVGISAIAARLKLTPRRVQQLVEEGLPRVTRGKYDVDHVLDWYIAKLQRELAGDGSEPGSANYLQEQARDRAAAADLKELKLAIQRGELVAIADVEKQMGDLAASTKARLLAVPARLAPDLIGETSRVMLQAKIEKGIKEALQLLAGTEPQGLPAC